MNSICLSLYFLTLSLPALAGDLKLERVFGPEIPTGPYKHPACLEEFDNGDLYLVYYGGEGEYATATADFGSRKKAGEKTWSTPVAIAREANKSVGNAVVWQAPDGVVWLLYVVREGATWSTSRIQYKVSKDRARTWSDSLRLSDEPGMMVRNRPIVLRDGTYLLPAYHETGDDPEAVGASSTSVFFRYDPKERGKGWKKLGAIRSKIGNIQPAPVEIAPGHLIAYCRRGGDYLPATKEYLVRAESSDNGKTWTEGKPSRFPNPNAAVDFLMLKSGRLLLVYNDCFVGRTPLSVALSADGDRTYESKRIILSDPGDYGYPLAFQARDGIIHVVFTSEKRSVVNHATFDEGWVMGR